MKTPREIKQVSRKPRICGFCKSPGHDQRNCEKRKNGNVSTTLLASSSSSSNAQNALTQISDNNGTNNTDIDNTNDDPDIDDNGVDVPDDMLADGAVLGVFGAPNVDVDVIDNVPALPRWDEVVVNMIPETELRQRKLAKDNVPTFKPARSYQPGPKTIPPATKTPLEFFRLFFTDSLIQTFCDSTNGYAVRNNANNWSMVTIKEFLSFISIVFIMGIVKIGGNRRDYWSNDPLVGNAFVKSIMSRRRFEAILRYLHFVDTSMLTKDEYKSEVTKNPFFQVDNYCKTLSDSFAQYYTPNQYVDVDEMSIPFKGRHKCRCYNPNKPEKWHFKSFCLNDSETGYLYGFYLYHGAKENRGEGFTATSWPVALLTSNEFLHWKNYIMCLDNWYTSLDLLQHLLESKGIHSVGTVKGNRKGLPKDDLIKKNGHERGNMKVSVTTINDKQYYLTEWIDNKPVRVLSTYKTDVGRVDRNTKNSNGEYQKVNIQRPTAIENYNTGMGGTDLFDQYGSYYRSKVRARRWPVRIFTHFMTAAAINAYILHSKLSSNKNGFLEFYRALVREMKGVNPPAEIDDDIEEPITKRWRTTSAKADLDRLENNEYHYPQRPGPLYTGVTQRGKCMVCTETKCSTKCGHCNAWLCIVGEKAENCFWKFHNVTNY